MEFSYGKDPKNLDVAIYLKITHKEIQEAYDSMEPNLRTAIESFFNEEATVADFLMGLELICREVESLDE